MPSNLTLILERLTERDREFIQIHEDIRDFKLEILSILDAHTVILTKLDQEMTMLNQAMRRNRADIDRHEDDVTTIKTKLNIGP